MLSPVLNAPLSKGYTLSPQCYMHQPPRDGRSFLSAICTTCQRRGDLPKSNNPNMMLYKETIKK